MCWKFITTLLISVWIWPCWHIQDQFVFSDIVEMLNHVFFLFQIMDFWRNKLLSYSSFCSILISCLWKKLFCFISSCVNFVILRGVKKARKKVVIFYFIFFTKSLRLFLLLCAVFVGVLASLSFFFIRYFREWNKKTLRSSFRQEFHREILRTTIFPKLRRRMLLTDRIRWNVARCSKRRGFWSLALTFLLITRWDFQTNVLGQVLRRKDLSIDNLCSESQSPCQTYDDIVIFWWVNDSIDELADYVAFGRIFFSVSYTFESSNFRCVPWLSKNNWLWPVSGLNCN